MAEKYRMTVSSEGDHATGAGRSGGEPDVSIDFGSAFRQIGIAEDQAQDLVGPRKRAGRAAAPSGDSVPALVTGAVLEFFEQRHETLRKLESRAETVIARTREALAAHQAGDEEGAAMFRAAASRAGAGLSGSGKVF